MGDVRSLEITSFLQTVREVREALRQEEPLSDERLRHWVQVAHRIRDGWPESS